MSSSLLSVTHFILGLVLAAAGSAIGLGNIWGFLTQAANNGCGAFLFVYLFVTILLAVLALYAEVYIGNQAQKVPVSALMQVCGKRFKKTDRNAGITGVVGAFIIHQGVHAGIERWYGRLMPLLLLMLIGLVIYILQQYSAQEGVALYLIPDFSQVLKPKLIVSAMGQRAINLLI